MQDLINQYNALDGQTVTRAYLVELFEKMESLNVFDNELVDNNINFFIKKQFSEATEKLENLLYNNHHEQFKLTIANKIENTEVYDDAYYESLGVPFIDSKTASQLDLEDYNGLQKPVTPNDIYDMITNKMLELIKTASGSNYKKKWKGKQYGKGYTIPFNFESKNRYRGVNFFMLTDWKPLENPFFLTFKQVTKNKGKIKKGSVGYPVVYFTKLYKYEQAEPQLSFSTYDKKKMIKFLNDNKSKIRLLKDFTAESIANQSYLPILKYYNVFNGKDIEGIDFDLENFKIGYIDNPIPSNEENKLEVAESIISNYPKPAPKLSFGGDKAFYRPSTDAIKMPFIADFDTIQDYYRTLFHEYSHSTGKPNRLDRDFSGKFGSKKYAFEELIAEWGAVFLSAEAGIIYHSNNNHAEYLKNWNSALTHIKDDNKFIMRACTEAQKVADFVLQFDKNGNPKYLKDLKAKISPTKANKNASVKKEKYSVEDIFKHNSMLLKQFEKSRSGKVINAKKHLEKAVKKAEKDIDFRNKLGDWLTGKTSTLKLRELMEEIGVDYWANLSNSNAIDYLDSLNANKPKIRKRKTQPGKQLALLGAKQKQKKKDAPKGLKISINPIQIAPTTLTNQKPTVQPNTENIGVFSVAVPEVLDNTPKHQDQPKQESVPMHKPTNNTIASKLSQQRTRQFFSLKPQFADLHTFLGKVERPVKESVVFTLSGPQGCGKTTAIFDAMNAFATSGYNVLHASLEEHPDSYLYEQKAVKYLSPEAQQRIKAPAYSSSNKAQILKDIEEADVIVIDSMKKMWQYFKGFDLDNDLRKKYNGKLFIIIFQLTSDGKMRGGSDAQFDGDIITFIEKHENFNDNYIYHDKNRFAVVPIHLTKYNIASQSLVKPEEEAPAEAPKSLVFS